MNNDRDNCGVAINLIIKVIDTGDVVFQEIIAPTPNGNLTTYSLLQIAQALPLLVQAIFDTMREHWLLTPDLILTPDSGTTQLFPIFTVPAYQ